MFQKGKQVRLRSWSLDGINIQPVYYKAILFFSHLIVRLLIPDLRQNLVNRGTYKNITDEFMTRDYISWFKKTKPTLQMETLPKIRLHEGYFSQFMIGFVLKRYFERLQFTKPFVAKKFKIPNFIVIITLEMTMIIGFSWDQFEPKFFMKILGSFNFMMLSMIMKSSISKLYQGILWIDQWSKIKALVQKPVKGRFLITFFYDYNKSCVLR